MMKIYILLLLTVISSFVYSQQGYDSPEFKRAVEKGTRSSTGFPGKEYWINHSDYTINAAIEVKHDTVHLEARASVTYFNNSRDIIKKLVIRSYPDFFAAGAVRSRYTPPENILPAVEYFNMMVEGKECRFSRERTSTNFVLPLETPLLPGNSVSLEISWRYYIVPGREIEISGIYDNGSFFISYWYPQIAVYDDIYGWDLCDYNGLTEFYNDFNDYDVTLTVPGSYMVWGSGELVNAGEVYPDGILKRYLLACETDSIVKVACREENPGYGQSAETKTWRFVSENSPDFSFAAARGYCWDATSVSMNDGRRVLVNAVYPPESKHYQHAVKWGREALTDLSFNCPGVPYPYPQMTIFNRGEGESGMESPMMMNNGNQATETGARETIYHETAHMWIPFLAGTNERRYAWMDEGWASYKGIEWVKAAPGSSADKAAVIFTMLAGTTLDIPLMISSQLISDPMASAFHTYGRSLMAFTVFEDILGREKADLFWKSFLEAWQYKHPEPQDMFNMMEKIYGEDLSWYIRPWFYTIASPDLALTMADTATKSIYVENMGGLPLPVYLTIEYAGGSSEEIYRPASVWKDADKIIVPYRKDSHPIKITLGNRYIYEADTSNNVYVIR